MNEAIEVWKDIPGYEGEYQCSSVGRVKSLEKSISINSRIKGKYTKVKKEIIMKQFLGGSCKYKSLRIRGEKKLVHRLIAQTFLDNHERKRCVNHKNGDKMDNCVVNLEWCTNKENTIHALRNNLLKFDVSGLKKYNNSRKKKAVMCTREGEVLMVFQSMREIALFLGKKSYNLKAGKIRKSQNHYFSLIKEPV